MPMPTMGTGLRYPKGSMTEIVESLGARVCGVGIGIEKGFQPGGKALRDRGIDLMSLAVVKEIRDGRIVLDDD